MNAEEPTKLVPRDTAPDPGVVTYIETLLARAKTGELQHVAMAGVLRDGSLICNWSGRMMQVIYATAMLSHYLAAREDSLMKNK